METMMWVKIETAARLMGYSRATVTRALIPWGHNPVPYKIRYKVLQLRHGGELMKRPYVRDVYAIGASGLPSAAMHFVPIFADSPVVSAAALEVIACEEPDERLWVTARDAAAYIDVSPDTIERLAVPLQATRVPYGIRRWDRALRPGGREYARYYLADAYSLLANPEVPDASAPPDPFHR